MNDHGPQRQPESDGYFMPKLSQYESAASECLRLRDELASLRAENERLVKYLEKFECDNNWSRILGYDEWVWDGDCDPRKLAADALRGDEPF